MKKLATILLASTLLVFSACKKDIVPENLEPIATGSWKIGSETFKINYSGVTMVNGKYNTLFAEKAPVAGVWNFMTVAFKAAPTVGTYKLVSMANNAAIVNADECQIGAGNNTNLGYGYEGAAGISIVVEKVNGKLKITIPEITVKENAGAQVKLSAIAVEI